MLKGNFTILPNLTQLIVFFFPYLTFFISKMPLKILRNKKITGTIILNKNKINFPRRRSFSIFALTKDAKIPLKFLENKAIKIKSTHLVKDFFFHSVTRCFPYLHKRYTHTSPHITKLSAFFISL